jgi:hypothetical protein
VSTTGQKHRRAVQIAEAKRGVSPLHGRGVLTRPGLLHCCVVSVLGVRHRVLVPNTALRQTVEEWEHAYALHVRRANIELEGPALAAGSLKTVYRGTLRLRVQGGGSRTVTVAVLKMLRGDCTTEAGMFLKLGIRGWFV